MPGGVARERGADLCEYGEYVTVVPADEMTTSRTVRELARLFPSAAILHCYRHMRQLTAPALAPEQLSRV